MMAAQQQQQPRTIPQSVRFFNKTENMPMGIATFLGDLSKEPQQQNYMLTHANNWFNLMPGLLSSGNNGTTGKYVDNNGNHRIIKVQALNSMADRLIQEAIVTKAMEIGEVGPPMDAHATLLKFMPDFCEPLLYDTRQTARGRGKLEMSPMYFPATHCPYNAHTLVTDAIAQPISLADALQQLRHQPDKLTTLMDTLADFLERWRLYAHQSGFSHGDLHATNILIDRRDPGRMVLIDFGRAYVNMKKDEDVEECMHLHNYVKPNGDFKHFFPLSSPKRSVFGAGNKRFAAEYSKILEVDLEVLDYDVKHLYNTVSINHRNDSRKNVVCLEHTFNSFSMMMDIAGLCSWLWFNNYLAHDKYAFIKHEAPDSQIYVHTIYENVNVLQNALNNANIFTRGLAYFAMMLLANYGIGSTGGLINVNRLQNPPTTDTDSYGLRLYYKPSGIISPIASARTLLYMLQDPQFRNQVGGHVDGNVEGKEIMQLLKCGKLWNKRQTVDLKFEIPQDTQEPTRHTQAPQAPRESAGQTQASQKPTGQTQAPIQADNIHIQFSEEPTGQTQDSDDALGSLKLWKHVFNLQDNFKPHKHVSTPDPQCAGKPLPKPKEYIAMKSAPNKPLLVRKDPTGRRYVRLRGSTTFLDTIRGRYVRKSI